MGKTKKGALLFGYSRLPGVDYIEPHLSARKPEFIINDKGFVAQVEIENFGQITSASAIIKMQYVTDNEKAIEIASAEMPEIAPFEKAEITLTGNSIINDQIERTLQIIAISEGKKMIIYQEISRTNE